VNFLYFRLAKKRAEVLRVREGGDGAKENHDAHHSPCAPNEVSC
jgi:hypothetical protein